MDLFPHDKQNTYLANRPNFPPSPQVLSLKEESSTREKDPEMREGGRRFREMLRGREGNFPNHL